MELKEGGGAGGGSALGSGGAEVTVSSAEEVTTQPHLQGYLTSGTNFPFSRPPFSMGLRVRPTQGLLSHGPQTECTPPGTWHGTGHWDHLSPVSGRDSKMRDAPNFSENYFLTLTLLQSITTMAINK